MARPEMIFPMIQLYIDDAGNQIMKAGNPRIAQRYITEYLIDYVEFCYVPLQSMRANAAVGFLNLLPRNQAETIAGRNVPSSHHRYIHFSASLFESSAAASLTEVELTITPGGRQAPTKVKVDTIWGIMEHEESGTMCYLYSQNTANAGRHQAGVLMNRNIRPQLSITQCFFGAWTGPYNLRDNNCIDYALRCWNSLCGTNVTYNDVCQAT